MERVPPAGKSVRRIPAFETGPTSVTLSPQASALVSCRMPNLPTFVPATPVVVVKTSFSAQVLPI